MVSQHQFVWIRIQVYLVASDVAQTRRVFEQTQWHDEGCQSALVVLDGAGVAAGCSGQHATEMAGGATTSNPHG